MTSVQWLRAQGTRNVLVMMDGLVVVIGGVDGVDNVTSSLMASPLGVWTSGGLVVDAAGRAVEG